MSCTNKAFWFIYPTPSEFKFAYFPETKNVPKLNHYNNKNLRCHKWKEYLKNMSSNFSERHCENALIFYFAEIKMSYSKG